MAPCGKCAECRQNRRIGWFVRLNEEMKNHIDNLFVTLTYDRTPPDGVNKRDVQLWLKRLRKKIQPKKIKYYLVGEYGTKTMRPHYHAILFNVKPNEIENTWPHGFTKIGTVTAKSIMYTTKYHVNVSKDNRKDLNKEFTLTSKGLGISYIYKNKRFHKSRPQEAYYPYFEQKMPLPRYYKEKLYTWKQRRELYHKSMSGDQTIKSLEKYMEKNNCTFSDAVQWHKGKKENFEKTFKNKSNVNNKI